MASYLSPAHLQGFDRYKYKCRDTSPLAVYLMHPFWNYVVKFLPEWLAPNLMTFVGWLLTVQIFLMMSYWDPFFQAYGNDDSNYSIPTWVWLYFAVAHFVSHTLDGVDGKQARRTGTSSALGELFDHGLDSSTVWLITMNAFTVFGIGKYSVTIWEMYIVLLFVMTGFHLAHWEKYNTGVLYLPWAYDLSQLGVFTVFLVNFFIGTSIWKIPIYGSVYFADLFQIVSIGTTLALSLPTSVYNVYISHQDCLGTGVTFAEGLVPFIPLYSSYFLFTFWAYFSPVDILEIQPRLFCTALGIVFSNITSRLIVSQMSSQKSEYLNYMVLGLALIVPLALFTDINEVLLLGLYTTAVSVAHIHYGICVVNELSNYLGIRCFIITPRSCMNGK